VPIWRVAAGSLWSRQASTGRPDIHGARVVVTAIAVAQKYERGADVRVLALELGEQ
jgi:hypothetical protein